MRISVVDRTPRYGELETEQLVLEPSILGEREVLDQPADRKVRCRERPSVQLIGCQVGRLGDDRSTFFVQTFGQTEALR